MNGETVSLRERANFMGISTFLSAAYKQTPIVGTTPPEGIRLKSYLRGGCAMDSITSQRLLVIFTEENARGHLG